MHNKRKRCHKITYKMFIIITVPKNPSRFLEQELVTAPSQPRANDPPSIPTTPVIIIDPDDEEGGNEPPVVTRPPPQMTFSAINGGNTHYGAGMDIEYVDIVRDFRIP